ncbi:lamin tail domain-containing protein [Sorangium sp. So ce861]|uniref:lamin tail domain-containing protein n=1 Tax=Sorangium sp. So ce861 TaxID=3133323 RepID=UPI003F627C6A
MLARFVWIRLPLLVSALAAAACAAEPPLDGEVGPEAALLGEHGDALSTRVRLMAANLTSGTNQSYDPGHGQRIMQGVKPDIVLLQEFNYGNNSTSAIRGFVDVTFGTGFSYFRESGAQIPNGIVSRWPIVESGKWDDSSVSNRDFAWARIDVPGSADLWAISVHFLTSSSGARNTEAQQLVSFIQAHVDEDDYLVIGGDFNTGSRSETCVTTLSSVVVTSGPHPVDKNGNDKTNAGRTKPYDWVLVDSDLEPLETAVVIGGSSFTNGLVVDTRVYSPLSEISPAIASDSGASSMQHMGVVRDFMIPDGSGGSVSSSSVSSSSASASGSGGSGGGGGAGGSGGSGGSGGAGGSGGGTANVIINEVLANEPGSDPDGEFVEIINVGTATASIGGWKLADSTGTRHTFPAGASLAPSTAVVVYGHASAVPVGVIGAVGASTGALGLNNSTDTVTLRNATNAAVSSVTYTSALSDDDGVSMNRSTDLDGSTSFVLHTTFGGNSSPGTRADGTAF